MLHIAGTWNAFSRMPCSAQDFLWRLFFWGEGASRLWLLAHSDNSRLFHSSVAMDTWGAQCCGVFKIIAIPRTAACPNVALTLEGARDLILSSFAVSLSEINVLFGPLNCAVKINWRKQQWLHQMAFPLVFVPTQDIPKENSMIDAPAIDHWFNARRRTFSVTEMTWTNLPFWWKSE